MKNMKVRLCQIREAYDPTLEDRKIEKGLRSRFGYVINPVQGEPTGELIAGMTILGTAGFEGFDLPLNSLPEGAKISDEFEIEFKPMEKRR